MNRPVNANRPQGSPPKVKTFKRRRCENCHALYQPTREDQRFCRKNGDNCRKEFHRYGSSYGPLKTGLHKAIDKKYAELEKTVREIEKGHRVEIANLQKQLDALRGQIEGISSPKQD